jgi:SAM-dependent methyltransferase
VTTDTRTAELSSFYDLAASSFDHAYRRAKVVEAADAVYNAERDRIESVVASFGGGRIGDVGAGTGYWLERYGRNVESAVLIEPSRGMRSRLRARVKDLALPVEIRDGSHETIRESEFDSSIVSGVLGHFEPEDRVAILDRVVAGLRPLGELLLVDSMWNARAATLLPSRIGYAARRVNGRDRAVYKHYFLHDEVRDLADRADAVTLALEIGEYFWHARLLKSST